MASPVSPEMDIVWKNGSGVRYTGSSLSSYANSSCRDTPASAGTRQEEDEVDNMEALERNNSRYLHHRRSTLPNLMNKYIIPKPVIDEKPDSAAMKKKRKKKKRTFSLDDEREQERRRQRETEKFLQIYDDLHRIRDHFYKEYMTAIRKKVEKQRKDIKDRDEALEKKRLDELEKQRLESHHVRKRHERYDVHHDDTYLHKIPKTQLFKIVQLQDKLKKAGNLRYNCEIDEFWSAIKKNPAVFNYYLEKLNADPGAQSVLRRRVEETQKASQTEGSEEEPRFDSDPTGNSEPTENWAVTQMYSHQNRKKSPLRSSRQISANTMARNAANELDRTCPKMEMPNLYCLNMDLTRKIPDPLEMLESAEVQAKNHDRKKYLRQLHKMHQLAITHQVAAQRILKKHEGELDMMFGGPDVDDLIDVHFVLGTRPPKSADDSNRQLLPLPPIGSSQSKDEDELEERSSTKLSNQSFRGSESSDTLAIKMTPSVLPLTMDEVKDDCKIVEAKCTSIFWQNYTGAGKPVVTR